MQHPKVLTIEDDPAQLRMLEYALAAEGMDVVTARNGLEGLRQFHAVQPQVVVLDVMMPEMDGWDTCRRIREMADVPVLMLTARSLDEDVVRGLSVGADDYMVKPFSPAVLVARVRALLRRTEMARPEKKPAVSFRDDWLLIDLEERRVLVQGVPVHLTATEFKLLAFLVENAGRVMTFRQALESVWGWEYQDDSDQLRLYVWRLRQKIEKVPKHPVYVLTEYGIGYRFDKQGFHQTHSKPQPADSPPLHA